MTENTEITTLKKIPTIIDEDKNTKLHYSAASGNEVDLLNHIKNEQKIDTENYLGWTPLMMACRNGHLNIVELLMDHRADATKKNKYGVSVFFVSITSGNLEIVHLILQHLLCGGISRQSIQKWLSPLSLSILFCHEDILKYLIEQDFNLNAMTHVTGITPMMFAAAMENCEAFALLVSKGADAGIKNCIGYTAQGIIDLRNEKTESKHQETHCDRNPDIVVNGLHIQPSQTSVHPYIMFSPQPTFLQFPANNHLLTPHIRKSSNTVSPGPGFYFTTPNVTPITPLNIPPHHQMFFPPEFSPNQIYSFSPMQGCYNNCNDFLNARMNTNNVYLSPIPQTMNYHSPCV